MINLPITDLFFYLFLIAARLILSRNPFEQNSLCRWTNSVLTSKRAVFGDKNNWKQGALAAFNETSQRSSTVRSLARTRISWKLIKVHCFGFCSSGCALSRSTGLFFCEISSSRSLCLRDNNNNWHAPRLRKMLGRLVIGDQQQQQREAAQGGKAAPGRLRRSGEAQLTS